MADDERRSAPDLSDTDERLRLMEAVAQSGVDAIVVTEIDHDGEPRIVFANDAFTAQTGWGSNEVLHQHPRLLVSADTDVEPQLALREAVTQRTPTSVELLHTRKDGTTFWVENTMLPVVVDGRCTHIVSFQRDISERKDADRALRESEERFRSLAEHASDVITVIDRNGAFRYTSPSVRWLLGHEPGVYTSMLEVVHPDDHEMVARVYSELVSQPGVSDPIELRLAHADGTWREVEALANNLIDDPMVEGMVVTIRDITDRKRAERMLAGQAQVLELLLAGRPTEESLAAVAVIVEEQAPGTRCAILRRDTATGRLSSLAAPNLPGGYAAAVDALEPGHGAACDIAGREGTTVVLEDSTGPAGTLAQFVGSVSSWALPVCAADGSVVAVVAAYHDRPRRPTDAEWQVLDRVVDLVAVVLERERAAVELAHRATHDPVTELPNRTLVLDRMRLSLARLDRREQFLAVLAVSIDRLDRVADSMGHEAAENVHITVAGRLQHTGRPEDTVGDLGGTLVVVAEAVEAVRGAVALAERVAKAVAAPHALPGGPTFLTGSIGIALGTSATQSAEVLLDNAVVAMRRASESGGGRYELFDPGLRDRVVDRLRIENGLHRALQRGELVLHYQPVLRLDDRTPVSVEALVRWADPERGLVPPNDFIPIAEDTGLIVALGEWVLETGCGQLAAWKRQGVTPEGFSVAVNVSPRQLSGNLLEAVVGSMASSGLRRGELCVEVTESTVMADTDASLELLRHIRGAGVQVAVDDFGTGHSSLGLLRQLPADVLKIDRSFVAEMEHGDSPIPAIVVNLAHGLGMVAVAEGVETVPQEAALRALGCDRSQGYLHCPPLPADEVARWLRRTMPDHGASTAAAELSGR